MPIRRFSAVVSPRLATRFHHGMPPSTAPPGSRKREPSTMSASPAHDRLDELGDDPRLVLAVGVQHHDHVRVALERLQVARLLVAAVADVVRVPDDVQRQLARQLDGVVGGGVVDEDDLVDPAARDARDGRLERLRRVAGGHDDDDLGVALAGRSRRAASRWVSSIGRGSVSSRGPCRPQHPRRSSRPTTSAASTASRSTATSRRPSGARSPACWRTSRASRRASCASASGATCA